MCVAPDPRLDRVMQTIPNQLRWIRRNVMGGAGRLVGVAR